MSLSKIFIISSRKDAFTLLEVTLVIILIVVMATVAFTKFIYVIERAKTIEAVKILREIKNSQIFHKEINGTYAGNGHIAQFSDLLIQLPETRYFYDIFISNEPDKLCAIFRNDRSYHLHISEDGTIYCTVDEGRKDICKKLGFNQWENTKLFY